MKCPPVTDPLVGEHYTFLKRFWVHKNAIKVNGVPLFVLLDWQKTQPCENIITHFRKRIQQDNLFPSPYLHVARVRTLLNSELYTPAKVPFIDSDNVEASLFYPYCNLPPRQPATLPRYCFTGVGRKLWKKPMYMSIMTSFDNTPRRNFKSASIYLRNFSKHGPIADFCFDLVQTMMYERCCQNPAARVQGGNLVFVNAWNEWGEGTVLEPTATTGDRYIKAVAKARKITNKIGCDLNMLEAYNKRYLEGGVGS